MESVTALDWFLVVALAVEVVFLRKYRHLEKMMRQAEADIAFWERKIKEWQ